MISWGFLHPSFYGLCEFSIDGSLGGNRENEAVKAGEGPVMRILIWHTPAGVEEEEEEKRCSPGYATPSH